MVSLARGERGEGSMSMAGMAWHGHAWPCPGDKGGDMVLEGDQRTR